jgi:hypothetical protein
MELSLPKTRAGWIALGIAVAAVLAFLLFATHVFDGHAVEISVQNAGASEIFASLDSTGRHGDIAVETMPTSGGKTTPPGLRIKAGGLRSFGLAVGFFDSPTLHIREVTDAGAADDSQVYDCAFDTIEYGKLIDGWKLHLPSPHVTLKWTGHGCERDAPATGDASRGAP